MGGYFGKISHEVFRVHGAKHANKIPGAARLVEEYELFKEEDSTAGFGAVIRRCQANRSSADDNDIVEVVAFSTPFVLFTTLFIWFMFYVVISFFSFGFLGDIKISAVF